ncbi:MAG: hemolysin family protein [Treponema sp.]|nr:hemolysin family protein [Treponema sp.]
MDNPASYYISLVATLLALLGLSAFFSVCETGFTSLNKIKLKNMAAAKDGHKDGGKRRTAKPRTARARLVLRMLESYDRLLSAVLIGNTLVNIASSAIATMLFIGLFGTRGVTIATLTMTVLVLVVAEISPKTLAKESPETAALRVAPLLRVFTFIFAPVCRLAGAWKEIIVRVFQVKADRSITEDEFLTFVEEARQEGGISKQEEHMIRQAIEFDETAAVEIVTPRVDLAAVSMNDTTEEIDGVFARTGFSRLPVYRENIDNITGVILLKDFHHEVIKKGRLPGEIVKPVVFVTKSMKISKLLRTLQEKKSHMAVLVDEFGGTLGIVTIEDIIEELVGEIWDEHDNVNEPLRENQDGSFTVLGGTGFKDMLEFITQSSASEEPADATETDEVREAIPNTTVGNWVMEKSGGQPKAGMEFAWRGMLLKVSQVQHHRVLEVVVTREAAPR